MREDERKLNRRIAARIRSARSSRNVSQSVLADHLEISFQQLQKIEKGVNRASAGRLFKIAEFLEYPIEDFFGGLRKEDGANNPDKSV